MHEFECQQQGLKAGTIIGIYQPIEDQIEETSAQAQNVLPGACPEHILKCSGHVPALLKQARPVCKTKKQYIKLASLLTSY